MLEILLFTRGSNASSPVATLPALSVPSDWDSKMSMVMDDTGENLFLLGGNTSANAVNRKVLRYNVAEGLYYPLADIPAAITTPTYGLAWWDSNKIYYVRSGKFYCLDIATNTWSALATPSNYATAVQYGGVAFKYNGRFMLYGGESTTYKTVLFEWFPNTGVLTRITTHPNGNYAAYPPGVLLGTVFWTADSGDGKLWSYNFQTNTWTSVLIPVTFWGSSMAAFNNRIFLLGTTTDYNKVMIYTPATGVFSAGEPFDMPAPTSMTSTSYGNKAYLLSKGVLKSYLLS